MRSRPPAAFYRNLSNDWIYYSALVCIVVLGLFVRIHQIGADDLWIDEAFTGLLALTPEWISYLRTDNTPPLYYLVMKLWCSAVTCGEVGLRLPSALAGTLFIALVGWFFRHAFGRRAALLMALIVAVSPIHVYYSHEARVYSLLLTTLVLFLFLQWWIVHRKATAGHYILLFVAGTCALYLHYLSLIVIGTYAFVYLVEKASGYRDIPWPYFLAGAGALLAFVPWMLLGLLSSESSSSELGWIAIYFEGQPLWQLPVRTFTTFLTGPELYFNEANLFLKRYEDMNLPAILYPANALLIFLFLCLYITTLAGCRGLPARQRASLFEASAYMILPLVGLIAASLLVTPVYVVGRYDLIAFPGFLMVGGAVAGIAFNKAGPFARPYVRAAAGVLVVLLITTQVYKVAAHRASAAHVETIKQDVMAVAEHLRSGDGLLVASGQAAVVWYYLHSIGFERRNSQCIGSGKRFTCRLFPREMEQAPASLERFTRLRGDEALSFELSYFVGDLAADSKIVLLLDDVEFVDGNVETDPIGAGIAASLLDAGYSVTGVASDFNFLVFARED